MISDQNLHGESRGPANSVRLSDSDLWWPHADQILKVADCADQSQTNRPQGLWCKLVLSPFGLPYWCFFRCRIKPRPCRKIVLCQIQYSLKLGIVPIDPLENAS